MFFKKTAVRGFTLLAKLQVSQPLQVQLWLHCRALQAPPMKIDASLPNSSTDAE